LLPECIKQIEENQKMIKKLQMENKRLDEEKAAARATLLARKQHQGFRRRPVMG